MCSRIGLTAALAAALALSGCVDCSNPSRRIDLLCGGQGTPAPVGDPTLPSACQPRAVMPEFFQLIDNDDPSLAGLRQAVADLGTPVCLDTQSRACTSDDDCQIGHCTQGLCPCVTSDSPLDDVIGLALRGMATIAVDPPEPGAPASPPPGCLSAQAAAALPINQRNRMCELRRTLDVLLEQNGGAKVIDDPQVQKVLVSLLNYVQGKGPDGQTHYDLLTPIGRMAKADNQWCDPAALWALLDHALGYLTPQSASALLSSVQTLLADPYTRTFLASLNAGGASSQGRDAIIVLINTLSPSIYTAPNGAAALSAINTLLSSLVFDTTGVPQQFKDEVRAVIGVDPNTNQCPAPGAASRGGLCDLLSDQAGLFPPLASVLQCASSPLIRCIDPARCDPSHDNQLIGALYDVIAPPEAQGGIDLATLVGALRTLTSRDQTGQTGRTLRLIVQGIEGSPDPNDLHLARDAVVSLAADALTAEEGKKLLPALSVLIQDQVVPELLSFLQDILCTCKPPPTSN
jgi:hypothetical protein